MLRLAGLGVGFMAMGSQNLAHAFLALTERAPVVKTCTSTTSQSSSYSYTNDIGGTWTLSWTVDPSCSGSGTFTVGGGDPQIETSTYTRAWPGPPPQTLTVFGTTTRDAEPTWTISYTTACGGGSATSTYSGPATTISGTNAWTATAVYTYECGWWPFSEKGLQEYQGSPIDLSLPLDADHVDSVVNVCDPRSRYGHAGHQLDEL